MVRATSIRDKADVIDRGYQPVDSTYIRDLRKKYADMEKVFGPWGNIGHGLTGGKKHVKSKIFHKNVTSKIKNGRTKRTTTSSKRKTITVYKRTKSGGNMKYTAVPNMLNYYVKNPSGKGFIKLRDVLSGLKKVGSVAWSGLKKASSFIAPHLKRGAETLLNEGVDLATKAAIKKLKGSALKSKAGMGVRGKQSSMSKDIIEKMIMNMKKGSSFNEGGAYDRMKRNYTKNMYPRSEKGGRMHKPSSTFLKKGAEWRNFAMKVYQRLKEEDPNILYRDALKVASSEWKA